MRIVFTASRVMMEAADSTEISETSHFHTAPKSKEDVTTIKSL
jgi:hypothetical protein